MGFRLPGIGLLCSCVLCWCVSFGAAADDPDARFGMWIEPAAARGPTGPAEASVLLSTTVDRVQGWSFGVRAQKSADNAVSVNIVGATMGADLLVAGPGHGEPAFHSCSLFPAGTGCGSSCGDCTGVTQGVVLDLLQTVFLDTTPRFEAMRLFLEVHGEESPEPAHLEFTNELGQPPVKTIVVMGGASLVPGRLDGSAISVIDCSRDFRVRAGSVAGTFDTRVNVPVYLDFNRTGGADFQVQAWSLGLRHDPAMLDLIDATTDGCDTLSVKGGSEPDFSQFRPISDAGEVLIGFTHGVIVDYHSAITLTPVNDFLDCYGIYHIAAEPPCPAAASTEIVPAGDLGDPVVRMVMVVEGESIEPCGIDAGTVSILCTAPFLRGDANADRRVDVADGIFILYYLFHQGDDPTCWDAADANDDGLVDSSDGVYIVNYQFLDRAPPRPPFPAPGLDPTPDALPDC